MDIQQYAALTGDDKTKAFEEAKKNWLRILLHDWYSGDLDNWIEEFLAWPDLDLFTPTDDTIAVSFGRWCHDNNKK